MKPPLPPTRGSSSQAKGNGIINSYGFGDCAITTRASCSSAFNYNFTEKATFTIVATTSSTLQHSREWNLWTHIECRDEYKCSRGE